MSVLVVGASRGSGAETVRELVAAGHEVTGFARSAPVEVVPGADYIAGDVMDAEAIAKAVAGRDCVVITLGISDNPLVAISVSSSGSPRPRHCTSLRWQRSTGPGPPSRRRLAMHAPGPRLPSTNFRKCPLAVRLLRRASTPLDVRSVGTARAVQAMQEAGVRRLVVQSTYGIGDTYARLTPVLKFIFSAVLRPQVEDSARQERVVRSSGLDWTILRPVALNDTAAERRATVRTDDTVVGMRVARRQVASVAAAAVSDPGTTGRVLSISDT